MASFLEAYAAWRREPFPGGSSDDAADELHADLALADTWVAEAVIPFIESGRSAPAQVDVLGELQALRDRAATLNDPERAKKYLAYVERLSDVYSGFLEADASIATQTVYVELVDEGVDMWRPVEAIPEGDDTFRLPNQAPDGEEWRFPPGSIVRCELRAFAHGEALTAIEKVG
jgi:hypothetical protein